MADILFKCEHCGKELEASDEYAGMQVECPECNAEVTIPAESQRSSDTVVFNCEHCSNPIEASIEYVGMEAECPECGQTVVIPATSSVENTEEVVSESAPEPEREPTAPPQPEPEPETPEPEPDPEPTPEFKTTSEPAKPEEKPKPKFSLGSKSGKSKFRPGMKTGLKKPISGGTSVQKEDVPASSEGNKQKLGFRKAPVVQEPEKKKESDLPFQSLGDEKSQTIKIDIGDADVDFMQPAKRTISIRRRRK